VTVSGTDAIGNAYVGTDSITFTISPTFYLDANGVTVKCRGCNAGDQGVVNEKDLHGTRSDHVCSQGCYR